MNWFGIMSKKMFHVDPLEELLEWDEEIVGVIEKSNGRSEEALIGVVRAEK